MRLFCFSLFLFQVLQHGGFPFQGRKPRGLQIPSKHFITLVYMHRNYYINLFQRYRHIRRNTYLYVGDGFQWQILQNNTLRLSRSFCLKLLWPSSLGLGNPLTDKNSELHIRSIYLTRIMLVPCTGVWRRFRGALQSWSLFDAHDDFRSIN